MGPDRLVSFSFGCSPAAARVLPIPRALPNMLLQVTALVTVLMILSPLFFLLPTHHLIIERIRGSSCHPLSQACRGPCKTGFQGAAQPPCLKVLLLPVHRTAGAAQVRGAAQCFVRGTARAVCMHVCASIWHFPILELEAVPPVVSSSHLSVAVKGKEPAPCQLEAPRSTMAPIIAMGRFWDGHTGGAAEDASSARLPMPGDQPVMAAGVPRCACLPLMHSTRRLYSMCHVTLNNCCRIA